MSASIVSSGTNWLLILRSYVPRLAFCSLLWEVFQLPLYSLWNEPNWRRILFNIGHCTVGDVMIGTAALAIARILTRAHECANWSSIPVALLTVLLAASYTLLSERMNLANGNWAYSAWMPILPWVEVGLAPLLQWIFVPIATLWWAGHKDRTKTHANS